MRRRPRRPRNRADEEPGFPLEFLYSLGDVATPISSALAVRQARGSALAATCVNFAQFRDAAVEREFIKMVRSDDDLSAHCNAARDGNGKSVEPCGPRRPVGRRPRRAPGRFTRRRTTRNATNCSNCPTRRPGRWDRRAQASSTISFPCCRRSVRRNVERRSPR